MEDDKDTGVHFGTGVTVVWWRQILRPKVIITAIVAVVLIVGGTIGYALYNTTQKTNREKQTTLQSAFKIAEAAKTDGDYKLAYETLKAAEGSARTKQEKVRYFQYLYVAAQNTNRLTESLRYREEIHKLDPGTIGPDAYLMAKDYEKVGDTKKALEQYRIALPYIEQKSAKGEIYADYVDQVKQKITELEKTQ